MTRTSYLTSGRLADLADSLSDQDWQVLRTLDRVRVADGGDLRVLHANGVSGRRFRSILGSLADERLITALPRKIGGTGSGSAHPVYALDIAGQRLLHPDRVRYMRPWPVGHPYLNHALLVTGLYVELVEAERQGLASVREFQAEPACWRRFYGPGYARMTLKPDAFVALALGRHEDRWFIEVDRGTESLPTVARKCLMYRRYWQNGREQAEHGVFPRVLWMAPDDRRAQAIVRVCGRQPADAWQLFTVATGAAIIPRLLQGAAT